MIIVLVFIFGLIVGSFLNAVIFRLHSKESIVFARSHCVFCRHELAAWDLIPLFSFIFLRGRCRYCKKKISIQYPIVELLTAVVFVLAFNLQPSTFNLEFWYLLALASVFIIIAVYDWKHYLILDKVVFPALVVVLIYNIFGNGLFLSGLIGGIIVSGFFALQYFISKGRWIGFGDVKFGLLLGNLFGIKLSLIMLLIAYFSGAIVGIILILLKRKSLGSALPFGVFLSFSAIIMLLYGRELSEWYFRLIGF